MKITSTAFSGDVNLGMYAKASDNFCIVANFATESSIKKIKEIIKTPTAKTFLAGTDLVGLFSSLNSNGILVPSIADEREIKNLKSKSGMNVETLKTKYTAIGNLILANNNGAVISKIFSRKDKQTIEDVLGVETQYATIAGLNNLGSCGIATNKGCLLHRDATEDEIESIKNVLKVDVDIGTANFGSPFVGGCIVANSHGGLIGETTTGPEVARIMETLGFI